MGAPKTENVQCAPQDLNPYGVCYPTGDVIPNFCLDDGTVSFCLAQLYDPQGELAARLIHITVFATWCGPCTDEADFITGSNVTGANPSGISWAKELAPKVVFLDVLTDGANLQAWIAAHGDFVPTLADPGTESLGVYFDGAAVPLNIDIDARTMKILDSSNGFDTNLDHTLQTLLASMK